MCMYFDHVVSLYFSIGVHKIYILIGVKPFPFRKMYIRRKHIRIYAPSKTVTLKAYNSKLNLKHTITLGFLSGYE